MKYKIGDKVRVKDGLKPDEYGVTPFMLGYCGKVMTVKSTYSILSSYYLVEDNCEFIWHEDTLEPVDSKTLRMADGTIIGEFNTGGTIPTSEWSKLVFKNGSSIEVLPQKDDAIRSENHFCTGFATPYLDLSVFLNDGISAKNGGKNSMKFTFYTEEGYRIDKSNNGKVETITTFVKINGFDNTYLGMATCDKVDYSEREGVINALANAMCNGNFDREFNKAVKANELADKKKRTCTYCGKVFDTVEERQAEEAWHVERRKARHERYLLRKRAKEIAFEEQAQKMAKEMIEK